MLLHWSLLWGMVWFGMFLLYRNRFQNWIPRFSSMSRGGLREPFTMEKSFGTLSEIGQPLFIKVHKKELFVWAAKILTYVRKAGALATKPRLIPTLAMPQFSHSLHRVHQSSNSERSDLRFEAKPFFFCQIWKSIWLISRERSVKRF